MNSSTGSEERRNRDGWRSQRGTVLVEFSLVAMLTILLLLGVFQFGFVYFAISDLNNAVRAGARYGSVHPGDAAAIKSNVVDHLTFANNSLVKIDVTYPDGNANADSRVKVTLQYTVPSFMPLFGSRAVTNSSTMRIEPS